MLSGSRVDSLLILNMLMVEATTRHTLAIRRGCLGLCKEYIPWVMAGVLIQLDHTIIILSYILIRTVLSWMFMVNCGSSQQLTSPEVHVIYISPPFLILTQWTIYITMRALFLIYSEYLNHMPRDKYNKTHTHTDNRLHCLHNCAFHNKRY